MITVSVRSYITLSDPPEGFKSGRHFPLTVDSDTTLAQLVERDLGIPQEYVAVVAVNGQVENEDYILQSQDRVDVFPPLAGG